MGPSERGRDGPEAIEAGAEDRAVAECRVGPVELCSPPSPAAAAGKRRRRESGFVSHEKTWYKGRDSWAFFLL